MHFMRLLCTVVAKPVPVVLLPTSLDEPRRIPFWEPSLQSSAEVDKASVLTVRRLLPTFGFNAVGLLSAARKVHQGCTQLIIVDHARQAYRRDRV
jgi:hypothetical protein